MVAEVDAEKSDTEASDPNICIYMCVKAYILGDDASGVLQPGGVPRMGGGEVFSLSLSFDCSENRDNTFTFTLCVIVSRDRSRSHSNSLFRCPFWWRTQ